MKKHVKSRNPDKFQRERPKGCETRGVKKNSKYKIFVRSKATWPFLVISEFPNITVESHLEALGLYNFVRRLITGRAYIHRGKARVP